ncbi:MAG: 50S ribosomal protein L18e [Thermoproteota archaeon]|jgi:large subunit ribosomal protein L18e|nr:50S ribosomal protein L18e [Thermoproteota archaeon]
MYVSSLIQDNIWTLRRALKKDKAPIWRALERELARPRRNRREINIGALADKTEDGQVVVIPGKVLGSGEIGHKLTVCAISMSESAAKKIIASGGRLMSFSSLIEQYPNGKGVHLVG